MATYHICGEVSGSQSPVRAAEARAGGLGLKSGAPDETEDWFPSAQHFRGLQLKLNYRVEQGTDTDT